MSLATFAISLKSAIDKLGHTLAVSKGLTYVDLDDVTATAGLFASADSAIVAEFGTLEGDPKDPLYAGSFRIGARTVQDPGNYDILKLVGDVQALFPEGDRIEVNDSYEVAETGVQGVLIPGEAIVSPQQYDMSSGLRLIEITFKAQRFV